MGGMQGMGGGMGGMGGMMGGMGGGGMGMGGGGMGGMGGGGFFRVEPEKVGKIKIVTVCLEHGKKDPSPHVPYKLLPADTFTKNQTTIETLKMLGRGEIDQRSAQAAAWNTESGLSWEELSAKVGAKHLNGSTEAYFSAGHIERGMRIVSEAERRAKDSKDSQAANETSTASAQQ